MCGLVLLEGLRDGDAAGDVDIGAATGGQEAGGGKGGSKGGRDMGVSFLGFNFVEAAFSDGLLFA